MALDFIEKYTPKTRQFNVANRIFNRIFEEDGHFYYKDNGYVANTQNWMCSLKTFSTYLLDYDLSPPQWIDRTVLEQVFQEVEVLVPSLLNRYLKLPRDYYNVPVNDVNYNEYIDRKYGRGLETGLDTIGFYVSEQLGRDITRQYITECWANSNDYESTLTELLKLGFESNIINKVLRGAGLLGHRPLTHKLNPVDEENYGRVVQEFRNFYAVKTGPFSLKPNAFAYHHSKFLGPPLQRSLDSALLLAPMGFLPTHCPITDRPLDWEFKWDLERTMDTAVITRKDPTRPPMGSNLLITSFIVRVVLESGAYHKAHTLHKAPRKYRGNIAGDMDFARRCIEKAGDQLDPTKVYTVPEEPEIKSVPDTRPAPIVGKPAQYDRVIIATPPSPTPPPKAPSAPKPKPSTEGTIIPHPPSNLAAIDVQALLGDDPPSPTLPTAPTPNPPPRPQEAPPRATASTPGHPVPAAARAANPALPKTGTWRKV